MATRARLLGAALAGVSLIALAGTLAWPSLPAPAQKPAVATTAEPAPPEAPSSVATTLPAASADSPVLGSRQTYEVEFTQTVILAANKDSAAGESTALIKGLHATWTTTLVSAKEGIFRYRGTLADVKAQANGQAYPAGPLLVDFNRPFFIDTNREGKVTSVSFDKATGSDARRTIKSLVASSQVVGHHDGADSWLTREQDTTGEYEARYTQQSDASHLQKERTHYLRVATESGLRPATDEGEVSVHDTTTIALLVNGVVDRIASQTETDMQFGKGMPRVHLTTVLATVLRKSDIDSSDLLALSAEWLHQEQGEMATAPMDDDPKAKLEAQRKADEKTLQAATLADLERELAALPKGSSRDRAVQMAKLRADFRLHPADAQKAIAYARTASVPDGQAIAGALGGTGTPEANKALVDLANTTDAPLPVRENAIGALALSAAPSPANVQALKSMTTDSDPTISSASTLALGAAASGVRGSDPGAYQDAVALLLADLAAAQSPQDMVLYLRALGNTGDPRVLPAAERAMGEGDASVHAAAIAAVRFVAGSSADQFFLTTLQSDGTAADRIQAVTIVEGYRVIEDYLGTFGTLLQADPAPLVRRAVLHALNVVKTNPTALSLIAYSAKNDPALNVRQYAQAILDGGSQVAQR